MVAPGIGSGLKEEGLPRCPVSQKPMKLHPVTSHLVGNARPGCHLNDVLEEGCSVFGLQERFLVLSGKSIMHGASVLWLCTFLLGFTILLPSLGPINRHHKTPKQQFPALMQIYSTDWVRPDQEERQRGADTFGLCLGDFI